MVDPHTSDLPDAVPPDGAGAGHPSPQDGEVRSVLGSKSAPSTDEEADTRATARRARKQVLLRLDPDVHAAVAKWAADDLRSVNAQIEVILRRALKDAGRDPRAAPMRGRGRPRRDV